MSLVSNFIGSIGSNPNVVSGSITPQLDINDTTFLELLQKQVDTQQQTEKTNSILSGPFGIPAGMQIDGMDGVEFTEKVFDQAEALDAKIDDTQEKDNNLNNIMDTNQDGEVTTSEMLTFFDSLLDNGSQGQQARSELFDFAKKQAMNFYNKYSRDVVLNVNEFVDDLKEKIV